MNSQIQCPVCTLFLLAGMNLQDHLETHPKEKVIAALVNMTLLQQQANDNADINNFQCSRYEPLSLESETLPATSASGYGDTVHSHRKQITYYNTPEKQTQTRRLMIVNRMSRVVAASSTSIHDNQNARQNIIPKTTASSRILHLIASDATNSSSMSIPPPPPYNTTVPLETTATQSTSSSYSIANPTHDLIQQCFEASETTDLGSPSPSSVRKKLPSATIEGPNKKLDSDIEHNTSSCSSSMSTLSSSSSSSSLSSSSSKESVNGSMTNLPVANISNTKQLKTMISNSKAISELVVDCGEHVTPSTSKEQSSNAIIDDNQENMMIDESCSVIHLNDGYLKDEDTLERNKVKRNTTERLKHGFKVLSDVKLSPNTALNMSTLTSPLNETVNLDHMIVIGSSPSKSAKRSTSNNKARCEENFQERTESKVGPLPREANISLELKAKTSTAREISVDITRDKPSTSREKLDVPIIETIDLVIESSSRPCSSKATSVIRLASPNKMPQGIEPPVPRPIVKAPYNKPPKKLIVKTKRPFVPVIEEEANLHPPELLSEPSTPLIKQEELNISANESDHHTNFSKKSECQILECSEDVPFSPLRQSFTPIPPGDTVTFEITELGDGPEIDDEMRDDNQHPSTSASSRDEYNEIGYVDEIADMDDIPQIIEGSEFDPAAIVKLSSESIPDERVETWTNSSAPEKGSTRSYAAMKPGSSNMYNPSTSTTSDPSSSTQNNFSNEETTARGEYSVASYLGYNLQHDGEYFYSSVRRSPVGYVANENTPWGQRFSSQYTTFEADKSSYMDLDMCKNTSSGDRAPSTDSLNIRTDEKMPAKGEISEQESNGDIDGSWSHQIYPQQDIDNVPRYMSSYDTTVARESWSLSNEQNLPHTMENISNILSKFTSIESADQSIDIKPSAESLIIGTKQPKDKIFVKSRKYRCPICPNIFSTLKERRQHLVAEHDYQEGLQRIKSATKTPCSKLPRKPIETVTSASCSTPMSPKIALLRCKKENDPPTIAGATKAVSSLNNYLLSYNWSILRAKPAELEDEKNQKVFAIIDSGINYACRTCNESFASIRAYDLHMFVHPAECYTCGRSFRRWVNFSVHLKRHLNIRDHKCLHCTKRFVLRQNMLEHMRVHSGEAPLKCKICSKRFKRYSNLIQHRNRHHLKVRPKEKDFICSCGEVFHSQAKIAWHRETHDAKPKCCPYCRERFMHKNSLVRHIRLSHTERFHLFKRDSVECPHCHKKYIKSSLKMHMEQHLKTKSTYECTICNKKLTTKWNLKQHKWIHASRSSKPFKCNLCSKAFIRETEYTSHMNTHKSVKPYTCDHCGCQFARKYNWLRHTREHETPKKFRCDTCGKVFHRAYYLTEHKRSHTGERPFECIICGKTSTTKTNHNKHVKIHHARDPLTAEG